MEPLRHVLRQHAGSLVDTLTAELARRSHSRYRELDRSILTVRCRKLVESLVQCAWEESEHLGEYVSTVADGRLEAGFELEELQRALRILEVNAWRIVANESTPVSRTANLTVLNTPMGFARDELARVSQVHAYATAAHQATRGSRRRKGPPEERG